MIGAADLYQDMQQGIEFLLLHFAMSMPWLRLTAAVPIHSGALSFFASLCSAAHYTMTGRHNLFGLDCSGRKMHATKSKHTMDLFGCCWTEPAVCALHFCCRALTAFQWPHKPPPEPS